MSDTEAQKRAKNKWKRENMQFFGVRMTNREAEAYRAACAEAGTTPNGYLLTAAREMIAAHAEEAGSVQPKELPGAGAETPDP